MNYLNSSVPIMTSAALSNSTHDLLREAMEGRHHHQLQCEKPCERKKWHVSALRNRFQKHNARQ